MDDKLYNIAEQLDFDEETILDTVQAYYDEDLIEDLTQRRIPERAIYGTLLFHAGYENETYCTKKEIAFVLGIDEDKFLRYSRKVMRTFDLDRKPIPIEGLMERIMKILDGGQEVTQEAKEMAEQLPADVRTRSPTTLGAGIAYLTLDETGQKLSQREIAQRLGITPASVRAAKDDILNSEVQT